MRLIAERRETRGNVSFNRLNNYHPDITLTIELNRSKFLHTKLANINGSYKFNVYRQNAKLLPSTSTSKTSKRCKRNTVNSDIHRLKHFTKCDKEIPLIKKKCMEVVWNY